MLVILGIIVTVTLIALKTIVNINGKEVWNGQKHVKVINIEKNINL